MAPENSGTQNGKEKKEIDLEDLNEKKEKPKGRSAKLGGIIALAIMVVIFVILAMAKINLGQWFADITIWYWTTTGEWGIYFGIFLLTLIGNATVIFPVPNTVVIVVISAILGPFQPWYFPLVIGIFAGLGAGVGETTAWFVGRGAREWAKFKDSERVQRMKRWIDKGLAPMVIFIGAATPLADDPFLMVLGFVGYPLWRALLWCFLGKWLMCFITSGITIWAANTDWGKTFIKLFGINIDALQESIATGKPVVQDDSNIITSTITWIVTFGIVIALIYVDWGKVAEKFKAWNTKRRGEIYPPSQPEPAVTTSPAKLAESKDTIKAENDHKLR